MTTKLELTSSLEESVRVPLEIPYFNAREAELTAETLADSYVAGTIVSRFESAFSRAVGSRHAVALASPSALVDLVVEPAGWGSGDEILTTAFGTPSAQTIARLSEVKVRIIDVDSQRFCMNLDAVKAAISNDTRAIFAVRSFGWQLDQDKLLAIAEHHGISVIEDATQLIEAQPLQDGCSWPRIYSLGGGCSLTAGGGAIVCTESDSQAQSWRLIANDRELGMSDLHCAVGLAQLEKLARMQALRAMIWSDYERALSGVNGLSMLHSDANTNEFDPHRAWVKLGDGYDQGEVFSYLRRHGIEAQSASSTVAGLGQSRRENLVLDSNLVGTERALSNLLALPCYPQLSPQQQEFVVQVLIKTLG